MNQKEYWNTRWINNQTGWDIKYASPALIEIIKKYPKDAGILIPGCGNAYEAEYLIQNNYNNITLIDISEELCNHLISKFSNYQNKPRIICADFFEHKGKYDLILEQTFFCAISPELRQNWCMQMNSLLKTNGKVEGVLFNTTFDKEGPPYGGSQFEYEQLFSKHFSKVQFRDCLLSIPQRKGTEIEFILEK